MRHFAQFGLVQVGEGNFDVSAIVHFDYILAINCNFTTLYTNVVPGVDDVLHLRNFGL